MSDYQNILVALDFSPAAKIVGAQARNVAELYNTRLTLVHVVEYMPPIDLGYDSMAFPDWEIPEQVLLEQSKEQLKQLAEKLALKDAPREVLFGFPKAEILRFAEEQAMDLIVVGSHGHRGLGRLLGSTANAVLHNAICDVLAVKIK